MSPLLRYTDRPWLVDVLAPLFRCPHLDGAPVISIWDLPSMPRTSRWTNHHGVLVQLSDTE